MNKIKIEDTASGTLVFMYGANGRLIDSSFVPNPPKTRIQILEEDLDFSMDDLGVCLCGTMIEKIDGIYLDLADGFLCNMTRSGMHEKLQSATI